MENKLKMLKKVGFISICIMLIVMILSLFFKDKTITLGVGLGCMIGLIGFNMILQWGYSVETGKNTKVVNGAGFFCACDACDRQDHGQSQNQSSKLLHLIFLLSGFKLHRFF